MDKLSPTMERIEIEPFADLSLRSLEVAMVEFITHKPLGRLLPSPRQFQLVVSEKEFNNAVTLITFDRQFSYPPIEVKTDFFLYGQNWYIRADGYDFVVGSWHDKP